MQNPEHGIRLRSSARTSTGQVRENNEDNIHLWTRDDFVLAIVADGMGGAAAGEEASRIAVEAIKAGFMTQDQRAPSGIENIEDATLTHNLRAAIQTANASIVEKATSSPEMRGMGTTMTMAFVRGTYAIVAHVGDSRAYLIDGDDHSIKQVTSDHSYVEALLAGGYITEEQAQEHPMKNVLYRALGQAEDVDVDMYYQQLHVGDRMVLCSDGLTRHVRPEEIARLSLSDPNPDVVSQRLIDLANERGGEDNISVIVISVEGERSARGTRTEAVIAPPGDDEDTLILKDRQQRGTLPDLMDNKKPSSIRDTVELSPSAPPDAVPTGDDGRLDDLKMSAERLKDDPYSVDEEDITEDSVESIQAVSDDTIDRAIAHRPSYLAGNVPVEESPIPITEGQGQDEQGEGRDTLLPEQ